MHPTHHHMEANTGTARVHDILGRPSLVRRNAPFLGVELPARRGASMPATNLHITTPDSVALSA